MWSHSVRSSIKHTQKDGQTTMLYTLYVADISDLQETPIEEHPVADFHFFFFLQGEIYVEILGTAKYEGVSNE